MLTGDNRTTAEAVGAQARDFRGRGRNPARGQGRVVEKLRKLGRVVAMAGDGGQRRRRRSPPPTWASPWGTGNRRRHRKRRRDPAQGRPARPRARPPAVAGDHAQHPAETCFFAFIYNAARRSPIAAGVLYPVTGLLLSPIHCRDGDGAVVGQRHRQCAAAAVCRAGGWARVGWAKSPAAAELLRQRPHRDFAHAVPASRSDSVGKKSQL